jgi:hypothetical protein
MARAGRVPAYKIGSSYKFNEQEILEWLQAQRIPSQGSPDWSYQNKMIADVLANVHRDITPGPDASKGCVLAGGHHQGKPAWRSESSISRPCRHWRFGHTTKNSGTNDSLLTCATCGRCGGYKVRATRIGRNFWRTCAGLVRSRNENELQSPSIERPPTQSPWRAFMFLHSSTRKSSFDSPLRVDE